MTDDAGTRMVRTRVARLCRRGAEKNFSAAQSPSPRAGTTMNENGGAAGWY